MVTVDDATYVKMRDTLYWGDDSQASRAKAKMESSYTNEQYNKFVSWLWQVQAKQQTQTTTVNNQPTTPTNKVSETTVKQQETPISTDTEIEQSGALKPLSQEYYNQTSDNALNTIRNNLNSYKQSNPEYFNNYEDYKKNFSYDSRNQEQKDVLDNFYNQYQKWLTLSSTPVNDLYTQYKDWQVSLADLELLKWNNPIKYTELQNQINKASILAAYDDITPTEDKTIQDMWYEYVSKMFNSLINGDYTSETSKFFEEYRNNMDSPEMMELQDKTTELDEQIKNIQDDIFSMQKEVEKEYEWTWATRSKISAIVADRTYELQQQLRTLWNEYEKYATQYNNRAQQYQNEFQLQLQEYQVNIQARNQQMSELWFAMDLMSFETPQQAQERQWDYWIKQQEYANWNINSSDYQTRYKAALKSVENLLSQYEWIPMQRSAEQMADDILKAIDSGSNLWAELTKINKQIQGKKEYKMLYNQTYGNKNQWFWNAMSIWGVDYIEYDWQLYTADSFNKKYWGKAKQYTAISDGDLIKWKQNFFNEDSFNKKYSNGKWGQCGKFVNDYLQSIGIGRYYDDDLSTKLASINSQTPTIWSIAVFDYNHNSSDWINHGHVGIVADILSNGDLYIVDSNFGSDGKIQYRVVSPSSTSLKWFFDPTITYEWTRTVSTINAWTPSADIATNNLNSYTNNNWMVQVWNTQFTPTEFDNYVKEYINGGITYSAIDKLWEWALNVVEKRKAELLQNWYKKDMKLTDPKDILQAERDYMTRFNNMNSETKTALQWTNTMNVALEEISKDQRNDTKVLNWASQAIVNAYNKLMDPTSTIRESEYARSPEWQSLIDQMKWKIKQLESWWAGLTYDNLKWLVDLANKFSEWYVQQQNDLAQIIMNSADEYGLNINNILPPSVIKWMQPTVEDEDYWSEYKSPTPSWYVTIDLGNGISITRP